ncbi:hypothetical protein TNCV_1717951 [Trichonephila clavipes]|nr:hypothetical protein TNCV_1717951 [Trichonephila clavipes]
MYHGKPILKSDCGICCTKLLSKYVLTILSAGKAGRRRNGGGSGKFCGGVCSFVSPWETGSNAGYHPVLVPLDLPVAGAGSQAGSRLGRRSLDTLLQTLLHRSLHVVAQVVAHCQTSYASFSLTSPLGSLGQN